MQTVVSHLLYVLYHVRVRFLVLTKNEVGCLKNMATTYLRMTPTTYGTCTWFYRNKSRDYFDKVFDTHDGVMKTLVKDASGDERSPINGEINGLFFLANVDRSGRPLDASPFGSSRLLVQATVLLNLAPNVYFADFYCMNGKDHYVTLVLARPGSYADRLCSNRLPELNLNDQRNTPFIFFSTERQLRVLSGKRLFVEVFFTENLNVAYLLECSQGRIRDNVQVFGSGSATQGGVRKAVCTTCRLPTARNIPITHYPTLNVF